MSSSHKGSVARIYKQDPSVTNIGLRLVYVPSRIADGPRDDEIQISGIGKVSGDANGDFIFDPSKTPKSFDAVHTFVVVRQVLTMYQRAQKRMGHDKPLKWQWGQGPIEVFPRAGVEKNAYYSRGERAIKFFYFEHEGKTVFTNRSFDVVAHETGHAILDALRPLYWDSWQPQTGGIHEAFGDITAILTMLSQLDQCEAIIVHSKADLHVKSFFNAVAEQFGEALYGHRSGLRNADNNKTLSEVSNEVHDLSQVFTGAFYDILADFFDDYRNPLLRDDAETLFRVGEHMADLLVEAILRGPEKNATYADIANKMIAIESNKNWKVIIRKHFAVRLVLGSSSIKPAKKPVQDFNFKRCHCTMSSKEHVSAYVEAAKKKSERGWFGRSK